MSRIRPTLLGCLGAAVLAALDTAGLAVPAGWSPYAAGTERTISGVKVKTHHESGLYAWIVVGADGRIVTHERDIRWDSPAEVGGP